MKKQRKEIGKLVLVICSLLTLWSLKADTLTIVHEDWTKAKTIAKKQNKLVLIDFYTVWCGPCKSFSKNLSKNDSLQKNIAQNYVMLKYDAEKDKTHKLSRKFHVGSYPTYIVVSPEFQFIHKAYGLGINSPKEEQEFRDFLAEGKHIFDSKTYPKGYTTDVSGDYPEFYIKAIERVKWYKPAQVEDYWKNTKDWKGEVSMALISYCGGNDEVNNYFINNKSEYTALYGEPNVSFVIKRIVGSKFEKALKQKDKEKFEEAKKYARKELSAEDAQEYIDIFEYYFAKETEDWKTVHAFLTEKITSGEYSSDVINKVCWEVYESTCQDKVLLNSAMEWMEDVVTNDPRNYAFMDTYACLLLKNKRYILASAVMEKAIALAKAGGINAEASQKVLDQINKNLIAE